MTASSPPDDVVAVDVKWRPTGGSGKPVLVQDNDRAVLVFDAARPPRDVGLVTALRRSVTLPTPTGLPRRVEVHFEDCLIATFGHPADDVRSGHPLADRGLGSLGLFEVRNSSWTSLLADRNKVAFPDVAWPPYPLRHFVATFKDATFECLCGSVRGRVTDLTLVQIVESLKR